MSHNHHQHCNHDMRHCAKCDVAYCAKCSKEWRANQYSITTYPWTLGGTTTVPAIGGGAGPNISTGYTGTVGSSHVAH